MFQQVGSIQLAGGLVQGSSKYRTAFSPPTAGQAGANSSHGSLLLRRHRRGSSHASQFAALLQQPDLLPLVLQAARRGRLLRRQVRQRAPCGGGSLQGLWAPQEQLRCAISSGRKHEYMHGKRYRRHFNSVSACARCFTTQPAHGRKRTSLALADTPLPPAPAAPPAPGRGVPSSSTMSSALPITPLSAGPAAEEAAEALPPASATTDWLSSTSSASSCGVGR